MQGRAVKRGRGPTEGRVLQIAIREDGGEKRKYRLAPDFTQRETSPGTFRHPPTNTDDSDLGRYTHSSMGVELSVLRL